MMRPILIFGAISGIVVIVTNTTSLILGHGQAWLGFLVMFIAFGSIYVAIRQYRDDSLGGIISFTTALLIGLGISTVASVFYVLGWELYLAMTGYEFIDTYSDSMLATMSQSGASEADLSQAKQDTEQFRAQYSKPLYRVPMTLAEIFPVGLLVSGISAGILRSRGVK